MLDNELAIETPEHVELSFALASIGNRFLACATDHIIQILLIFAIALAVYSFEVSLTSLGAQYGVNWVLAGAILLVFLIGVGYFVAFETLWNGQTPGKRWMRLRVVRQDARPIGFYEALIRNLIRLVDMMPMPSYFIGIVSIFFSQHYRRLGDYAAGTVVVKERATEAPQFAQLFEAEENIKSLGSADASAMLIQPYLLRLITSEEIRAVDAFLRRRASLEPQRRQFLAYRIAAPLMMKMRVPIQSAHHYEAFLETLHQQYTAQAKYLSK
ncbi:MAG: RDD family protein [Acidobacteriota bacterium]|nr:RDD family protein [Blastocatellia bacterium]MDW8240119.1 RDD family protein [Acidobacteriota bacterium]